MLKREEKIVSEKEFLDNLDYWFDFLNKNLDAELIVSDENGKKLVVMAEKRFHNIYDEIVPDKTVITYEDFCNSKK